MRARDWAAAVRLQGTGEDEIKTTNQSFHLLAGPPWAFTLAMGDPCLVRGCAWAYLVAEAKRTNEAG